MIFGFSNSSISSTIIASLAFLYATTSLYLFVHYDEIIQQKEIKYKAIEDKQYITETGRNSRVESVTNAIHHAWSGYSTYALDADELLPISRTGQNNWGHLQWTLVDSLDTLYIAGLHQDLKHARDHLAKASFNQNSVVSTFEMTIRLLGGTLSTYELTKDPFYLSIAESIGNKVLGAFGAKSGIPAKSVHMIFGHPSLLGLFQTRVQSLVGAGSLQLELSNLSYHTGKTKYAKAGRDAISALAKAQRLASETYATTRNENLKKLYPMMYNIDSGEHLENSLYFTMGSGADSFYEYLLKLYILEGCRDEELLNLYVNAMDNMMEFLVKDFDINGESASILVDQYEGYTIKRMNHLACFVPGMLALGAFYGKTHNIPVLLERYDDHMRVSRQLMKTCVYFYTSQPTGLSAEEYKWVTYQAESLVPISTSTDYRLRPETVESLFILYRVTGDSRYREIGWEIFQSIEKHCRTDIAYASVKDVTKIPVEHEDKMESFMISETLKYLQLLFSDEDILSLDKYVFTTEAHPLAIHDHDTTEKKVT